MGEPEQWRPGLDAPPEDLKTGTGPPGVPGDEPPKREKHAPSMEGFPQFEGYGNIGFAAPFDMPPPPAPPPPREAQSIGFSDIGRLDEEACRAALVQHVSEQLCYSSKPAKEMKITKHEGATALHLILETYTEGRSTKYKRKPYKGGPVDGPENGPPPLPWDIPTMPSTTFKDDKQKHEVPHTAVVKPCHECHAKGYHRCWRCSGWGQNICTSCGGSGRRDTTDAEGNTVQESCFHCGGSGRERCLKCGGDGRITCDECDGYKKLKCFIRLKVKFENHKDDFILEATDMPDELIRNVGGVNVFEVTEPRVWPVTTYPVKEINDNSVTMVDKHSKKWPDKRIFMQRHTLRGVPVTEVHYKWEDFESRYWVYGSERKVYAPDYPQQCCCGCSIL